MILAGIDEAGYGPLLGPMVVGCCAVEFAAPSDPVPNGWKLLSRIVCEKRDATGKRLHVNDSKKVYSPSTGLAELERAVLCLHATRGNAVCCDLDALLADVAAESVADLAAIEWYRRREGEAFPLAAASASLGITANLARVELQRAKAAVVHLHAHVLPETKLNRMFDALRNKGATSFTFVAQHLDRLLKGFADRDLVIVCDRQGGRSMYGGLLRQMFEDWSLEVLGESPERSEYRLANGDRSARLIFAEKAESLSISVALASMLSKYLRESLMGRFNAHWQSHDPAIAPTAGYWTDGQRFLRDLEPTCARLGIDVESLARTR